MAERAIGHIDGVVPGEVFSSRVAVKGANLHGDTMRGISRLKDADGSYVADAIVLNGGYEDDEDGWTWIRYTGASPDKEKTKDGKRLLRVSPGNIETMRRSGSALTAGITFGSFEDQKGIDDTPYLRTIGTTGCTRSRLCVRLSRSRQRLTACPLRSVSLISSVYLTPRRN